MRGADHLVGRGNVENLVLLASAARTETGTGDAVLLPDGFEVLVLQCELTAAATDVGDTLDVFVQTTIDGTTWLDIAHFTQMLGNGGAKRFISKVSSSLSLTEYETGTALGAAAVRHIFGSQYRVRWDITDAGTDNASFTFSVKANAQ